MTLRLLAALLTAGFVLSSCAVDTDVAEVRQTAPGPTAVPEGMGSQRADGNYPRTVTHFGGSTEITAEPARIVVLGTGQLDGLLTLGVVPIGVASGDGAELVPNYLAQAFPEQTAAFADVGRRTDPSIEAIAALDPDLILGNKAGSGEIFDVLSAIAPTVLTEGTGVNWKQDFLLLADAVGRSDEARTVLGSYAAEADTITTSATVSFVRFTGVRARVFGTASFPGFIAWDAGLGRPQSQQFDTTSRDFSEEEIQLVDADWVFVSSQNAQADGRAAEYTSSALWSTMTASKAGQIVDVDDDTWYLNAGPTAALQVLDGLKRVQ